MTPPPASGETRERAVNFVVDELGAGRTFFTIDGTEGYRAVCYKAYDVGYDAGAASRQTELDAALGMVEGIKKLVGIPLDLPTSEILGHLIQSSAQREEALIQPYARLVEAARRVIDWYDHETQVVSNAIHPLRDALAALDAQPPDPKESAGAVRAWKDCQCFDPNEEVLSGYSNGRDENGEPCPTCTAHYAEVDREVAREREACAKVADTTRVEVAVFKDDGSYKEHQHLIAYNVGKAIRSRGVAATRGGTGG